MEGQLVEKKPEDGVVVFAKLPEAMGAQAPTAAKGPSSSVLATPPPLSLNGESAEKKRKRKRKRNRNRDRDRGGSRPPSEPSAPNTSMNGTDSTPKPAIEKKSPVLPAPVAPGERITFDP